MKEHSRLKELAKNLLERQSRGFARRARMLNGMDLTIRTPHLSKLTKSNGNQGLATKTLPLCKGNQNQNYQRTSFNKKLPKVGKCQGSFRH